MDVLRQLSGVALSALVYAPAVVVDYSDELRRVEFSESKSYFLIEL